MNTKDATQVVDHFAKEIAGQLHTLAPQALAIMVGVKQADSLGRIVTAGLGLLAFAAVAVFLAITVTKNFKRYHSMSASEFVNADEPKESNMWGYSKSTARYEAARTQALAFSIAQATGVLFCSLAATVNLSSLLDQWVWIGFFRPEIAVYHDIVVKVLGS